MLKGDKATAQKYYTQLASICPQADSPARPELVTARAMSK